MKNKIQFENGISHDLTTDEIRVLRLALKNFNEADLICSADRQEQLLRALESLRTMIDHLD